MSFDLSDIYLHCDKTFDLFFFPPLRIKLWQHLPVVTLGGLASLITVTVTFPFMLWWKVSVTRLHDNQMLSSSRLFNYISSPPELIKQGRKRYLKLQTIINYQYINKEVQRNNGSNTTYSQCTTKYDSFRDS